MVEDLTSGFWGDFVLTTGFLLSQGESLGNSLILGAENGAKSAFFYGLHGLNRGINEQKAINIQKMKDAQIEETYGNYMQFYQDDSGNIHEIDLRNQIDRINEGKKYTFQHDGFVYYNNEGYFPKGDYMEWVVPTPGVNNRAGKLRIITGEGHMWFMPNHHKPPFFLIK